VPQIYDDSILATHRHNSYFVHLLIKVANGDFNSTVNLSCSPIIGAKRGRLSLKSRTDDKPSPQTEKVTTITTMFQRVKTEGAGAHE